MAYYATGLGDRSREGREKASERASEIDAMKKLGEGGDGNARVRGLHWHPALTRGRDREEEEKRAGR